MKSVLFFLGSFFCGFGVVAQMTDTSFVTIGTETGVLSKQQIADQYDYVFGTKVPATWMFKWNPVSGVDKQGSLNLSVEHKISPALSLQLAYGLGGEYIGDSLYAVSHADSSGQTILYHHFNLQTRWYFDMPRRIRQSKSANNFSGNYLALELAHSVYGAELRGEKARFASNTTQAALRFGMQRRIFKHAYVDVSYGLGARHAEGYNASFTKPLKEWAFFASTQFAFGIAIFRPKADLTNTVSQCDILQCFREENRMWKVDLFNLVRISDSRNAKGTVRIAFEQKIAQSAFSLEVEVHGGALTKEETYGFYKFTDKGWNAGFYLQPRLYYMMKKQIAKGKTGNNLSGPYFAMNNIYTYTSSFKKERYSTSIYEFDGTIQSFRTGPIWGFQLRMFKHAFIDLNVGMGIGFDFSNGSLNGAPAAGNWSNNFDAFGNLRVGLAF